MEEFKFNVSNTLLLRKLRKKILFVSFVGTFAMTLLMVILFHVYRIGDLPVLYEIILILLTTLFFVALFTIRALIQWDGQVNFDGEYFRYSCGFGFPFYKAKISIDNIDLIAHGQDYYDAKVGCYTAYVYLRSHWTKGIVSLLLDWDQEIEYLNKEQVEKIQAIKPKI